jgi:hypothetical protein
MTAGRTESSAFVNALGDGFAAMIHSMADLPHRAGKW